MPSGPPLYISRDNRSASENPINSFKGSPPTARNPATRVDLCNTGNSYHHHSAAPIYHQHLESVATSRLDASHHTHRTGESHPVAWEKRVEIGNSSVEPSIMMTQWRATPARPRRARNPESEVVAWCDGRCGVPTCRQSFTRHYDAERHVREQAARSSGSKSYACTGCGMGFQRSDALRKHERDAHGI